jgi:hypothetical protein
MYSVYVSYSSYVACEYPEVVNTYDSIEDSGINIGFLVPDRDTFSISGEVRLLEIFGNYWFGQVNVFSEGGQLLGKTWILPDDSLPHDPADSVYPSFANYEIDGLPSIQGKVSCFVFDYLPQYYDHAYEGDSGASVVRPGAVNVDFLLEAYAPDSNFSVMISGTILGAHGPLSEASVYAKKSNKIVSGSTSGYDGGYYLYGLEPGSYTIYATRPGYYTDQYMNTVTVADSPVFDIDIKLEPKTGVEELGPISHEGLELEVSPNPSNLGTNIRYAVTKSGPVSVRIYDATGSLVKTVVSENQFTGIHTIHWDGRDSRSRLVL